MSHVYQTYIKVKNPTTGKRDYKLDKKGNKIPHPKWKFEYIDFKGMRKSGTGYVSKKETEKLADRTQSEQDEIRKGYREPPKPYIMNANTPIENVVSDYLSWGNLQGGRNGKPWSLKHAKQKASQIRCFCKELRLAVISDLNYSQSKIEKLLQGMRKSGTCGKTLNNYIESIKSFCEWATNRQYFEKNPLSGIIRFDSSSLVQRRAMTQHEIEKLLSVVPEHRAIVYETALMTGLRVNELRNLTLKHLNSERCAIMLDSEWTKNRKAGVVYITSELLSKLHRYGLSGDAKARYVECMGRRKSKAPYPLNPLLYINSHPARRLELDLAEAGVEKYIEVTPDGQGGKLDFHSLRTTFINLVLEENVDVKTAQTAARHTNPQLTFNTYGRVREESQRRLAENIGSRFKAV